MKKGKTGFSNRKFRMRSQNVFSTIIPNDFLFYLYHRKSREIIMNGPKFPIVSIYNNSLDIISSEMELSNASVVGILKGSVDSLAFDVDGDKWNYFLKSDRVKNKFWTRLLANTFYNPTVKVVPQWSKVGRYHIDELKGVIKRQIDKDDDILTQFVEPATLIQAIDDSNSFEEICRTLNKNIFNYTGK